MFVYDLDHEIELTLMAGIMKKIDTTLQTLNDLLKINTDRVERYKKASYDTRDSELKTVFCRVADESRKNITDISIVVLKHYGDPEVVKVPREGKVYKSWLDVKSKFNGTLRNNLLNSCEFSEMAALSAYTMAKLDSPHPFISELIERQQQLLQSSLQVIKSYRQAYDKLDRVFV